MPCVAAPRRRRCAEVLEGAELGMDRLVAALLGADGPGAADVAGLRRRARCSCPCAACGRSDGSAAGTARRSPWPRRTAGAPRTSSKVPCAPGFGRGGAREQLVPGAEARALAVDHQRQLDRMLRGQAAVGIARGEVDEGLVQRQALRRRFHGVVDRRGLQLAAPARQRLRVGALRALGRGGDLLRADLRGDADVLGVDAACHVVAPGLEGSTQAARCSGSGRARAATNAASQRSLPSGFIGSSVQSRIVFASASAARTRSTSWPSAKHVGLRRAPSRRPRA